MLTENSLVYGLNGRSYRLGPKLGSGGEATVYEVSGEGVAVKIYPNPQAELEQKLRYMVMHPVPSLTDQYGNSILNLAWPRDIVYDQQGFVGYAMPKLENALEIFHVVRGCTSLKAKTLYPNYTWVLNIRAARNLALSVFHLHSSGYVIGDMNDKNILVRADGSVCILDIDSFDFTDRSTGTHYKCCVGLADYLAPELQARNLRSPGAVFSEATDDFALAIHIFQLLMEGYHPFTCRRLVQIQNSSSADQRVQQIVDGRCPYVRSIPGYDIPLPAPTLQEMLPENLCQDFVQTLLYDAATAMSKASSRTTAEQWGKDLNEFLKQCLNGDLVRCSVDPDHFYLRSKGSCGLCSAQSRYEAHRARTPAPVSAGQARQSSWMQTPQKTVPSPTPQPTCQTQDTFFQRYEFYITDEEARAGGSIAVYQADGTKEYHSLPSYADMQSFGSKVHIRSSNASVSTSTSSWHGFSTIYNYSDGCLRQYVRIGYLHELLSDIPIALLTMLKWWLGIQFAVYGLDWICEAIFGFDLFASLYLAQLVLYLPPIAVSISVPYFFIVPMNSIFAWLPYLLILLFTWTEGSALTQRGNCKRELQRRSRL